MTIRRARESDLGDLVAHHRLLREHLESANPRLWAPPPERSTRSRALYDECLRSDSAVVFVADQDGRIMGSITARVDERLGTGPKVVGHIQAAFVLKEWRGRGVGAALVGAVLDFFESKGAEDISLRYVVGNQEGERFWRGLGFEPLLCTANARPDELRRRLRQLPR